VRLRLKVDLPDFPAQHLNRGHINQARLAGSRLGTR
jgi:hypothetical protein